MLQVAGCAEPSLVARSKGTCSSFESEDSFFVGQGEIKEMHVAA